MMSVKTATRRSGVSIMARLILLLGRLSAVMVLAVLNGTVGFLCAMGGDLVRCRRHCEGAG